MALLAAHAYGFATTFKPKELAVVFSGASVRVGKRQIVAEYEPDRMAVAYDFGAVVFINVPSDERARALGVILARIATDEPHPPLEEDFSIEVDPSTTDFTVHFERVVVPALGPHVVDLVGLLLAQSVSIDYYEEDLQEVMRNIDVRTDRMVKSGRVGGSNVELNRFVASTMATKNQIVAALSVLDKPAVTWEDQPLDKFFRDLRLMLEIEERFRALEYKLRTIQETLELFLDMSQTRRMLFLEGTIVVLILFEIVMSLVGRT